MILRILQIGILLLGLCACKQTKQLSELQTDQLIKLSVNVNKSSVRIGDLISYNIKVEADTNVLVIMPQFAENLGGFMVNDWDRPEPTNIYGKIVYLHSYKLETYLTGTYEIPEANIIYIHENQTNQLKSSSIIIDVVSIASTNDLAFNELRDIKPAITIYLKSPLNWKIIIALVLFLALVIFIIIKLSNRNKYSPPPIPAHEQAYIMLRRLHERKLLENNMIKEYFFDLITILRYYISIRFDINAPDQTTEEFMSMLQEISIFNSEQKKFLKELLVSSDLIKFANAKSSIEYANTAHDSVVSFIEDTKIEKTVEDQNANV